MYSLAIFDLDGTLLNTLDDLADACNRVLARHGYFTHETEAYRYFVGDGIRELIRRVLPEDCRDEKTLDRMESEFHREYGAHSQDRTRPYAGVVEALTELRGHGVKIAVLSNKSHSYVPPMLDRYFPGLVDVAFGKREGIPPKPDPAAVREIMEQCGCARSETAYIGDTDVDMRTGQGAGLYTIGVSWGFRTKNELENGGANVIVDKAEQLVSVLVDNLA